jgi:hypothetical protein
VIGSSIFTSEAAIAAGFFGVTIYPGNQLCLTTSDAVHPSIQFSLKRAGCLRFDSAHANCRVAAHVSFAIDRNSASPQFM